MANIPLNTSDGIFTKLGHQIAGYLAIMKTQGGSIAPPDTTPSLLTRVSTIVADYAAGTAEKGIVDGIYTQFSSYQNVPSFVTYLQQLAQSTLIDMSNTSQPLVSKTVANAMLLLISQMNSSSNTVNASTIVVGAQTAVGSPNGTDTTFVVSSKDGTGRTVEYAFSETLTFTVTNDSQSGATALQEPYSVTGQNAASSTMSYAWPAGSGQTASYTLIDASQNNTGGNLLYNSDFETWTNGGSSTPDNWIELVGTPGTDVLRSSTAYSGSYSMELHGDGSTLVSIAQTFNTTTSTTVGSGGTPAKLLPDVPYALNFWYAMTTASPAAGVFKADLVDGSNTTINDDQGTANSLTITLTSVADTNWHNANVVFRLPKLLPSTVKLRLHLSTALTSGKHLLLDRMAMSGTSNSTGMSQFYKGGPYIAGFSGTSSTKVLKGDQWTVGFTVSYGAVQREFERLFGMKSLGLILPSTTTNATIGDGVII